MRKLLITCWLLILLPLAGLARADDSLVAVPPLSSHVIDQIQLLQPQQRQALEGVLAEIEQRTGSQIAVRDDGAFVGSVSGGCVEGAVIEDAMRAMKDGKTSRLGFGVSDQQAWDVGLACGGRIEIYVEPVA